MLQVVDHHWKDHLLGMDHLRDGIGLRGYGQKDPLIEYKKEGYDMFSGMMHRIKSDALERMFRVQAVRGEQPPSPPPEPVLPPRMVLNRSDEPTPQIAQHPAREGRSQRSLSLRQRQEIQKMSRNIVREEAGRSC